VKPTPTPAPTPTPEPAVTIDEKVLLDEKDVKITLKRLILDDLFGPEIQVTIENNTNQNLTFQVRNESVNRYMVSTLFSCDVAAGKKPQMKSR